MSKKPRNKKRGKAKVSPTATPATPAPAPEPAPAKRESKAAHPAAEGFPLPSIAEENGPATGQSDEAQIAVKQTDSLLNLDPRQALPAHPAAKAIPPLSDEEYAALLASIDEHGLLDPIEVVATPDGYQVNEGVHRQRACLKLGVPLRFRLVAPKDPYDYAEVRNSARRHYNSAQKRERIAAWLVRHPDQSDHVIATKIGATHPTVGKVRAELEAAGTIPKLDRTLGTDGKSYQREKPDVATADEADDSRKIFPTAEADEADTEAEISTVDDEADEHDADNDYTESEAALAAKLSADELAALMAFSSAQVDEVLRVELSLDERATVEALRVRQLLGRAFADDEMETLRAANHELERKCLALESELEELKAENAKLHAALAAPTGEEVGQ